MLRYFSEAFTEFSIFATLRLRVKTFFTLFADNRSVNAWMRNERTAQKRKMFGRNMSNVFTLAATQMCNGNTGKLGDSKVLARRPEGCRYREEECHVFVAELKHGRFATRFRMSVRQFEALLQKLRPG